MFKSKSKSKPNRTTRPRLCFERLEDRLMMAGDVAAYVQNGSLYLNEAAGSVGLDQGVLISQVGKGLVRVAGTSASGAASKINGGAYRDFAVSGSLFVSFGAGNDKVEFSAVGGLLTFQSIDLNLGPPTIARGVADADTASLTNFQTIAGLSISTGAGADHVYLNGGTVGNYQSSDQLWIRTGAGADYVSVQTTQIHGSLFLQTYDAWTENDADTVYLDKNVLVAGNATLGLGGGGDQVFLGLKGSLGYDHSLYITGTLSLDTGDGVDQVTLYDAFIAGSTVIRTGAGADTVNVDGTMSYYGSATWLNNLDLQTYSNVAENDVDTVTIGSVNLGGDASIRMGGGNDQFSSYATDPAYPDFGINSNASVTLDTGTGDDQVSISNANVDISSSSKLYVYAGAGADTVNIANCHNLNLLQVMTYDALTEIDNDKVKIDNVYTHGGLTVYLGAGDDWFDVTGDTFSFTSIYVDAGAGQDTGYGYGVHAQNQITFKMGDGDDRLSIDIIQANQFTLSGDGGYDRLGTTNKMLVDVVFSSGWESYNNWNPLAAGIIIQPGTKITSIAM